MLSDPAHSSSFAMGTVVGRPFLNSTHSLDVYDITSLWTRMYVAKGTAPRFLKGLENT